jgi:hypothetical protein
MIKPILYGFLGVALSASGVGIIDKPWQFIVILGIVFAIDYIPNNS